MDKRLALHANDSFVEAGGKRITKASKFNGFKPWWVFKTGDRGLGYYRDSGGMRTQLSLDLALRPMRSLPVATINLDDLVISDADGESREHLASGIPGSISFRDSREHLASGIPESKYKQEVTSGDSRELLASGKARGKGEAASMNAIWKLAAQATAVFLGAKGGSHSCTTSLAKPTFSILRSPR